VRAERIGIYASACSRWACASGCSPMAARSARARASPICTAGLVSPSAMSRNIEQEAFMMTVNNGRETEMSRAEAVRLEVASAGPLLGGDAPTAKEQTIKAARASRLSARIIERLRYLKINRIAADVADTIRDAVSAQQAKQEALARHE